MESLLGQPHHHGRVLTNGVEHHGTGRIGDHFAQDVDAFGFKRPEMGEGQSGGRHNGPDSDATLLLGFLNYNRRYPAGSDSERGCQASCCAPASKRCWQKQSWTFDDSKAVSTTKLGPSSGSASFAFGSLFPSFLNVRGEETGCLLIVAEGVVHWQDKCHMAY